MKYYRRINCAEKALWVAVLKQAVLDLDSKFEDERQEAIKWMSSNFFNLVCKITDIDRRLIKKKCLHSKHSRISTS